MSEAIGSGALVPQEPTGPESSSGPDRCTARAAVRGESGSTPEPSVFAVTPLRELSLWCITVDGEPLTEGSGQPITWVSFNDAYDAKEELEQEARRCDQGQEASLQPSVSAVGACVVDTRTDRAAVVAGVLLGRLYLRKPGGGVEWEAMPAHVRLATKREQLSARVAEANLRSRFGGLA